MFIHKNLWKEISEILDISDKKIPPTRVIKEQRATFEQTPEQNNRRPNPNTPLDNLFLAGDWTNTGLPATLESAVVSGRKALELSSK